MHNELTQIDLDKMKQELDYRRLELMPEIKDDMVKSITVSFDIMSLTDEFYSTIMDYIERHPGKSKLIFKVKDYEHEFTLELASKNRDIEVTQELIDYIKEFENIEYKLN